jgi:PadR family transcriptional regulator PadR
MEAVTPEERAWKKGTAEFLVLAQLENERLHGYEIALQISKRSGGALTFNAASLYPVLYRLERRGYISGRWVEKAGQRRRRYYQLTASGRHRLNQQRESWKEFTKGVQLAAGGAYG